MSKKLLLTYGRFQPVHIGHHKIFTYMWSKFINEGFNNNREEYDDCLIFLSSSKDDRKNPLSHEDRIKMIKKNVAGFAKSIGIYETQIKDIIHLGKELDGKYDELHFVLGSDRSGETMFDRFVKYNGKEYNFKDIKCYSVPRQSLEDKNADFISSASGTSVRNAARYGNKDLFMAYVGGENKINSEIYETIKNKIC